MNIDRTAAAISIAMFLSVVSGPAALASTNPDTPTALTSSTIIARTVKDGDFSPQYFSFSAGPGTVTLRLTLRPNSDGVVGMLSVQDPEGKELAKIGDGTSHDQDLTKTISVDVPSEQALVLKVSGSTNVYGTRHATMRIQIDGDVHLDKKAQPLTISLVQ